MIELWPFTNFHDMNLDWIIRTVKVYTKKVDDFIANITEAWNDFKAWTTGEIDQMHDDFAEYVNVTEGALNTGAIADGAITAPKLNVDLLRSLENYFVMPEMFGAVGDGVTDDSAAFQDAIDSGLPVYGLFDKTYVVHGLTLGRNTVGFCNFKSSASGQTAFTCSSYANIENCDFNGYEYCIVKPTAEALVHALFSHNRFMYSKYGIYLDASNGSVNNTLIENNYFVKCGTNPNDYSTPPTPGHGYGLALIGNWDGLKISGNVFEYNTYCGIYMYNTNTNFRVGANVTGNYFEGNKECAIEVEITRANNMLNIDGNYFSFVSTNVTGATKYIKWIAGQTTYKVSDGEKKLSLGAVFSASNNILNTITNRATYDETTTQYWQIVPLNRDINRTTVTVYYKATINNDVVVKNGSNTSETVATITNGNHSFTYSDAITSFYVNRSLAAGESVIIYGVY